MPATGRPATTHVRVDAKTRPAPQRRTAMQHRSAKSISRAGRRWRIRGCRTRERQRASMPPLAPQCAADALERYANLRIDGIGNGAAIARAPGSEKPAQLSLKALGASGKVLWLVNGKLEGETSGAHRVRPRVCRRRTADHHGADARRRLFAGRHPRAALAACREPRGIITTHEVTGRRSDQRPRR